MFANPAPTRKYDMTRQGYLNMLKAMTGITEQQMEDIIRPVYESDGGKETAARKLKEISGEPLVETRVINEVYFEDLPSAPPRSTP
jgi:hypothetical protein